MAKCKHNGSVFLLQYLDNEAFVFSKLKAVSEVLKGSTFKHFRDHLDDKSGSVQALKVQNGTVRFYI